MSARTMSLPRFHCCRPLGIDLVRYWLEVLQIHAIRSAAEVVDLTANRDRAD